MYQDEYSCRAYKFKLVFVAFMCNLHGVSRVSCRVQVAFRCS